MTDLRRRGSDCSHISGLLGGAREAPGHDGKSRGAPIADNGLEGQACYRRRHAPVRTGAQSDSVARRRSSSGRGFLLSKLEWLLIAPHRPDDARELVGERDGGLVVSACSFARERPAAQAVA